ncbi:hypothetical protein Sjap_021937 [Stephania japonica]|uniref:Uncharacterized protein n=1 Tax=Stephania japonica TaxID=461633 RepID=A0AAP0EQI6_9MAGN
MDALRKLEDAQRSLLWMQEEGITSNHCGSDRFLSDFLLFLAKPCGSLTMEDKCLLISQHLPKVIFLCLKGVHVALSLLLIDGMTLIHDNGLSNLGPYLLDLKSLHTIDRTPNDLILRLGVIFSWNDFAIHVQCRSYFMFHEMDVNSPQSFFKFLPVLSFTGSYIYQLDDLNEKLLTLSTERTSHDGTSKLVPLSDIFKTDPFWPLIHVLECHELLNERIRAELKCGEEYWTLERKLCIALDSNSQILVEDVMRAVHLKSFDYRVLNLLLYQLMREEVNDLHMEFLSVSEFLVEISDDLFDYEDDVLNNSFNILRMFVRIYGASMAPIMLAKSITEAEGKYAQLLKALDPDLSLKYQKRCEEATREGGNTGVHPLGMWTIPPVIVDENCHRSEHLSSKHVNLMRNHQYKQ